MDDVSGSANVIQRFFEAFNAGDMAGAFALLSPDIVWTYHGPEALIPFAGRFVGHEGVTAFFARVNEVIEVKGMETESFVSVGHQVFGRGVEHSVSHATGQVYRVEWVHIYEVRDGLMTRFDEFIDTAAVAAALNGTN